MMYTKDICKFIPNTMPDGNLLTLNFVYECEYFPEKYRHRNAYSFNLVTNGEGLLHTRCGQFPLEIGDVFFTLPQQEFWVKNTGNLHYIYISFIGIRANAIMDRIVSDQRTVFKGFHALIPHWRQAVNEADGENLDLMTEGLLLYSLAQLCRKPKANAPVAKRPVDIIVRIKQYAEEHFREPALSLREIAALYGYNHKYISQKFIRTMSIGFNDYLQDLRICYAAKQIEDGMQNVAEVAKISGFTDPFYFSRLFKEKHGISPKQYVMKLHGRRRGSSAAP